MRKQRRLTKDITGFRSGMLEAISYAGSGKGKSQWLIRCDCGVEKIMAGTELTKGKIKSCGCNLKQGISDSNKTHGMSHHPAYAVWRSMQDRCRLPTHQAYANYGARGISVCERWSTFEAFWEDMAEKYMPGLTLDREDNNGNYNKNNCRWVSRKIQTGNTRSNVWVNTPKGRMLLSDAATEYGINHTTLSYRIMAGWPEDKLFIEPDVRNRLE
jgi:hypothetical protein